MNFSRLRETLLKCRGDRHREHQFAFAGRFLESLPRKFVSGIEFKRRSEFHRGPHTGVFGQKCIPLLNMIEGEFRLHNLARSQKFWILRRQPHGLI